MVMEASLCVALISADLPASLSTKPFGIETAGRGETQPVKDNKTKEGKAANRRVEFNYVTVMLLKPVG
jgi:outer membrane protein OmpA-like peptidoglycan-associated protein